MKKVLLVLSLMTVLWSCKKSDDQTGSLKSNLESSKNKATVKWAGDGKWDLLGFGYDITGDVLNGESASDAPIIDMARFERDYLQRLGSSNTGSGTQDFYVGVSALDYLKDVVKRRSMGITASHEEDKKFYFSGSISRNTSDQNTTTYSSRYSYASFESFRAVKRLWFTQDAPVSLLADYLTPEFINNVATQDAESLVRRYGTHVLLDITIGGKLRLDYSSAIVKQGDYTKDERTTKIGLLGGVKKILGLNFDETVTNEEITKVNTESRSRQYTLKYFGGTNSGRTISFDSEGNTSESLNIASWEQSVIPTNAALVHVHNAVPIYEFIADPIKKSQIKAAVEQYIIDNQITLSPEPIYSYYDGSSRDHYFTYINTPTLPNTKFNREGIQFYAYASQAPGSVPVYVYYDVRNGDHYFTTINSASIAGGAFVNQGVVFYAYTSPVTGTVPVYMYYSRLYSDHYITTVNQPTIVNGRFVNEGIIFYAHPNAF